jgi:hypothetical protein
MIQVEKDAAVLQDQADKLEGHYAKGTKPPPPMDPVTGGDCGGRVVDTYAEYFECLGNLATAIKKQCDVLANDPNLK